MGIKTVGEIPCNDDNGTELPPWLQCLPQPSWPLDDQRSATGLDLSAADVVKLLGPAISIALVGYMESMTIAKTVERQEDEKIRAEDASKE